MISREAVNATVRSKQQYWAAMVRNNYVMPAQKAPLCTLKWMQGIREGQYWCPRSRNPRHFQVASVPTRQQLAEILLDCIESHIENDEELPQETCNAMMRTADLVLVRPPEAQWIINVIGYLNGAHEIF